MARSRHVNPSQFSVQQLQELRRTHGKLRRLNRAVLVHMARMRRQSCEQQRLSKLLGVDARQINSLLALCDRIIESDKRVPLVVSIQFVCAKCTKHESIQGQSESTSSPGSVDVDPAWVAEIDFSLDLVHQTEELIFLKGLFGGTADDRLFSSLNGLRKALLREKTYAARMSPEQKTPAVEREQVYTCTCEDRETDLN